MVLIGLNFIAWAPFLVVEWKDLGYWRLLIVEMVPVLDMMLRENDCPKARMQRRRNPLTPVFMLLSLSVDLKR